MWKKGKNLVYLYEKLSILSIGGARLIFMNSSKGTSINDVPRFLAFFDLPTYLCPIWSLLEKAAYLMTSFFV